MQIILFPQDGSKVAMITPVQEYVDAYGIDAIARKDVPPGVPYRIMNVTELPEGPQEEWVIDFETLTDGVGGAENTFPPGVSGSDEAEPEGEA